MKHAIYRLAVVAAVLAAVLLTVRCTKETGSVAGSGAQGRAGEGVEVTLTAVRGVSDTRAGLSDGTTSVNVTWSEGDVIYVVGETDGLRGSLTLSSGAGGSSASFRGCISYLTVKQNVRFYYAGKGKAMTSDTFSLDITSQDGTLDGIESLQVMCGTLSNVSPSTLNFGAVTLGGLIAIGKFDIINCTGFDSSADATLSGAFSRADLNLRTGEFENADKGQVITLAHDPDGNRYENYFIALIPSGTSQTLAFSQAGKTSPKKLADKEIAAGKVYMSKGPDGTLDNPIEVGLYPYGEGTDFQGYGRIIGGLVWAPVNCGHSSSLTYGRLYQFGRKAGTTYGASWSSPSSHAAEAGPQTYTSGSTSSPDDGEFYEGSGDKSDWYSGTKFTNWPSFTGDTGYLEGKIDNPCPENWRVPTKDELNALLGGNSKPALAVKDGQNGVYLNGTASCSSATAGAKVFLPAAGGRAWSVDTYYDRGVVGRYYTSTVNGSLATALYFKDKEAYFPTDQPVRACGFSVRCVRLPDSDRYASLSCMSNVDDTSW